MARSKSGGGTKRRAPGQSDADLKRNLRTLYRKSQIEEGADPKKLTAEGRATLQGKIKSRTADLDPFKGKQSVSLTDLQKARESGALDRANQAARSRIQADAQAARADEARRRKGPVNRSAAAKKAAATRKMRGK